MKKLFSFSCVILGVLILAGLSSCKKDNLELLSDTVWDFENFSTTSENSSIQSLVALGKAVLTDGTMEFTGEGNYTMDSPVMEAETGTWELIGSSQITFTTNSVSRPATIEDLTKSKLVYFETYIFGEETYSVKYTWVK